MRLFFCRISLQPIYPTSFVLVLASIHRSLPAIAQIGDEHRRTVLLDALNFRSAPAVCASLAVVDWRVCESDERKDVEII